MRRRDQQPNATAATLDEIAYGVDWNGDVAVLARAIIEVRNLVIGLGIDTTEETERLDAHVSALEEAKRDPLTHNLCAIGMACDRAERGQGDPLREIGFIRGVIPEVAKRFEAERDALQQQLADCRAAMAKYGRHIECNSGQTMHPVPHCTCGFADALATTSEDREA